MTIDKPARFYCQNPIASLYSHIALTKRRVSCGGRVKILRSLTEKRAQVEPRHYSSAMDQLSMIVPLVVVYGARQVEWVDEKLLALRVVFGLSVLIVAAVALYIRTRITSKADATKIVIHGDDSFMSQQK